MDQFPIVTKDQVRRLAVIKQKLANPLPVPTYTYLHEVLRAIRCLQLDPINHVARPPHMILWSRMGHFNKGDLEAFRWDQRILFEFFAHAACMVLTEDYPIFAAQMRHRKSGGWRERTKSWLASNETLKDEIIARLEKDGPLAPRDFEAEASNEWVSTGWTNNRTTNQMLDVLLCQGDVMVSDRRGGSRFWDLTDKFLPADTPREAIDLAEAARRSAIHALRALGIATPTQIKKHFTRGWYHKFPDAVLKPLLANGTFIPVTVMDGDDPLKGDWYMLAEDQELLSKLDEKFYPRTTLLSPFDNLICDRDRTEQLFDFHYRIEIYVPKAKREFGYYVLPILHGDRLIGRIDSKMNRKSGVYEIHEVYREPDAPRTKEVAAAIGRSIAELATFLGASSITYERPLPHGWAGIKKFNGPVIVPVTSMAPLRPF